MQYIIIFTLVAIVIFGFLYIQKNEQKQREWRDKKLNDIRAKRRQLGKPVDDEDA